MNASIDGLETQELLPDGKGDVKTGYHSSHSSDRCKSRVISRAYIFALHGVLVILAILLWRQTRHNDGCISVKDKSWSPVNRFVKYETNDRLAPTYQRHSVYSGIPTDEQDKAWDTLIEPTFFNVSREELQRAGESMEEVVEASDGGYLAALGVYHEIHCLASRIPTGEASRAKA
ncbi:hypothetical protein CP533_3531 [Ophiocordyceps camponoti-saundersi (nom. inval.)]|nr:hypothetical protein CP533_3531 [Ophiocordyceps camponoti-saundersi (nom. inval.)]